MDHATATNQGVFEAQKTTGPLSPQKPDESSAAYETRLGAFNMERATDAEKSS